MYSLPEEPRQMVLPLHPEPPRRWEQREVRHQVVAVEVLSVVDGAGFVPPNVWLAAAFERFRARRG